MEQRRPGSVSKERDQTEDISEETKKAAGKTATSDQVDSTDIDAILEDIDKVLDVDSEAFVRGYVQKGGQ
jgi:ubiquitin-like protein Pup